MFNPQIMTWKIDSKKYNLLARIMQLIEQPDYEEAKLKKYGEWSLKAIFALCH